MLFSSLIFLYGFLPSLLFLYFLVKNSTIRKYLLIIFSLVFYAWGEPIYVFLMLMVITFNYLFGILIAESNVSNHKKIYLTIGVTVNLLILIFFKYIGLIINTLNTIPSINIPYIEVSLPLGISFYIFQALTYIVDVYRGDTEYQKKYSSLLLYVSFFPQLIAGPIVKYKDIEKELEERRFDAGDALNGVFRFSIGLSKKVLIANALGKAVDILLNINNLTKLSIWLGMIYFLLQLYFDFSGYSDMAIGLGKVFGFHYKENFNYPYVCTSITDFWRRWHISLSSFFREYVYIPLGGKYHFQMRNIFIVWALTGLWHGASYNFCLWGIYFAVILIIEKYLLKRFLKGIFTHIYTLFILIVGFVLFYFEDIATIQLAYSKMFSFVVDKTNLLVESAIKENIIILIIAVIGCTPLVKIIAKKNKKFIIILTTFIIIILFTLSTISIVGDTYNPFLYFRF